MGGSAVVAPQVWVFPPLYEKQYRAIYAPERIAVIEASTKSGKTHGCMLWLLSEAERVGGVGRHVWWVAPYWGTAEIAFNRYVTMLEDMPRCRVNRTRMTIKLPNGTRMSFKSGDRPDTLYGEDVWAAVVDEATRCRAESWYALRSTLTATRGRVRIIGNVKGRRNWAYGLARAAQGGAKNMSYHKLTAWDAVRAGVLEAEEVLDARNELPEDVWQELYMAIPTDDGGNPFGLQHLKECAGKISEDEPVVWGVDLAKTMDWSVAIALDANMQVCRMDRWRGDWEGTINRLLAMNNGAPMLVDSTGVGDPIVERLQRVVPYVEGFTFTSKSKQQLMESLCVDIQRHRTGFPAETVLASELDMFEYVYSRTGVRYAAPEGQHDDTVMAYALACWLWHTHCDHGGMRITSLDDDLTGVPRIESIEGSEEGRYDYEDSRLAA